VTLPAAAGQRGKRGEHGDHTAGAHGSPARYAARLSGA
jgi:hypothetical protein